MNEIKLVQERRSRKDRRATPTSPFTFRSLVGSRRLYRRKEDSRKFFFVDLYSGSSVILLVSTLVLSLADAFFTLRLVSDNIGELNPVMNFFLRLGPFQFIMIKWFMTAFGLTTLLILKNYYLWQGRIRVFSIMSFLPFLYLVLVTYEAFMLING
ncbi:conserved membrane hypothetical protein [Syntrophobacter sp. SbD1]|nr:conserved membrane hypothetical protein [Syntrophobacter sp. SbD1]